MNYTICMPIYKELPHIEQNLFDLDDWKHLLIIDNSPDGWCHKFEHLGCKIAYYPENIGVARSWNLGIKEGKDYTFFVSSSVKFNLGFNEVIIALEKMIAEEVPGIEYGLFTQLGWHCNAITQKTVDTIGLFDENFYPAYMEDVDYCRRMYLAGIHVNPEGQTLGSVIPTITIDASPIQIAVTIEKAGLKVDFDQLGKYYRKKWGQVKPNERYDSPFRSGNLKYFPEKTVEELKEDYGFVPRKKRPCSYC